ncbi:MAG: hypothetical protein H0X66_12620 [Verrucomicrobia bacterium]|nr:hypothetical protein [Verrucomicrobiota bacterium]
MERRGIILALVCASVFGGAVLGTASEKIKFSTPSQSSGVASEERTLPNSSPSLFDKFRNGGADGLHMPMPQPQNRAPQRDIDDKKDWIFAKPEDGVPSAEDMFKRRGTEQRQPGASGLARYVEQVERQEAQSQPLNFREKPGEQQEAFNYSRRDRSGIQSTFADPNFNKDPDKFGRENFSFSDYWKETTGMNPDRFAEQADIRRAEFQQIFEPRSTTIQQITGLNEAARGQPANLLAPAPTDFSSRTSQSSVSDSYQTGYMPMTGSRTTVFDDVNARALGRDSSSPLNTRMEQPRVQSQPAILPFPTRPGELFKRPGSY